MKEAFEFTPEEVTKILFEELVRRGKAEDKRCGIQTRFNYNYGQLSGISISIVEPVPGAKEL